MKSKLYIRSKGNYIAISAEALQLQLSKATSYKWEMCVFLYLCLQIEYSLAQCEGPAISQNLGIAADFARWRGSCYREKD